MSMHDEFLDVVELSQLVPLCRQTMMSDTCAHFSTVPCLLGFKTDQNGGGMAVVTFSHALQIEAPIRYPSL